MRMQLSCGCCEEEDCNSKSNPDDGIPREFEVRFPEIDPESHPLNGLDVSVDLIETSDPEAFTTTGWAPPSPSKPIGNLGLTTDDIVVSESMPQAIINRKRKTGKISIQRQTPSPEPGRRDSIWFGRNPCQWRAGLYSPSAYPAQGDYLEIGNTSVGQQVKHTIQFPNGGYVQVGGAIADTVEYMETMDDTGTYAMKVFIVYNSTLGKGPVDLRGAPSSAFDLSFVPSGDFKSEESNLFGPVGEQFMRMVPYNVGLKFDESSQSKGISESVVMTHSDSSDIVNVHGSATDENYMRVDGRYYTGNNTRDYVQRITSVGSTTLPPITPQSAFNQWTPSIRFTVSSGDVRGYRKTFHEFTTYGSSSENEPKHQMFFVYLEGVPSTPEYRDLYETYEFTGPIEKHNVIPGFDPVTAKWVPYLRSYGYNLSPIVPVSVEMDITYSILADYSAYVNSVQMYRDGPQWDGQFDKSRLKGESEFTVRAPFTGSPEELLLFYKKEYGLTVGDGSGVVTAEPFKPGDEIEITRMKKQ